MPAASQMFGDQLVHGLQQTLGLHYAEAPLLFDDLSAGCCLSFARPELAQPIKTKQEPLIKPGSRKRKVLQPLKPILYWGQMLHVVLNLSLDCHC